MQNARFSAVTLSIKRKLVHLLSSKIKSTLCRGKGLLSYLLKYLSVNVRMYVSRLIKPHRIETLNSVHTLSQPMSKNSFRFFQKVILTPVTWKYLIVMWISSIVVYVLCLFIMYNQFQSNGIIIIEYLEINIRVNYKIIPY